MSRIFTRLISLTGPFTNEKDVQYMIDQQHNVTKHIFSFLP